MKRRLGVLAILGFLIQFCGSSESSSTSSVASGEEEATGSCLSLDADTGNIECREFKFTAEKKEVVMDQCEGSWAEQPCQTSQEIAD
jgi:hypothetical protein